MLTAVLRIFILLSCLLVSFSLHAVDDQAIKVKWGYKGNIGPERWGDLSADFAMCDNGNAQSPIDLTNNFKNVPSTLKINYTASPLTILEDGNTQLQIGNVQTIINDGHSIQINFPASVNETISLDNKEYRLIQFHFHTPSENQWQDRAYPLEIHFVHQGDNGKVVVIGVPAKGGAANPALQKIIEHFPLESGKEVTFSGETINPLHLLPTKQAHYSFQGSLTTPPCLEGLTWIVMANPITVSPAQIVELRREMGGENARPVQPLNGRQITYSKN